MSGQAVAVVDDQGQARWVEMLHSEDFAELYAVASAPDGDRVDSHWIKPVWHSMMRSRMEIAGREHGT